MGLFEVLIANMMLICGETIIKINITKPNLTLMNLKLFAPNLIAIFGISTSNNIIINQIYAWERWRASA